ncbi:MAG: glycine zipper 2TM domain-containing protein, partial [Paraperlucidibaca sp.]
MDLSTRKIHPLIILATLAVLIVSAVASAKALGWLPIGSATAAESDPATTIERVAEVPPAPAAKEQWHAIESKETVKSTPVRVAEVKQQPIQNKPYAEYGNQSKATTERYASCVDCGVVTGITPIAAANGPTGIGAVLGAVAGGVIGHQIGGGNGRKIATVAGA